MSVSGTAQYMETILNSLKDSEGNTIKCKVDQGDLEKAPQSGSLRFTIQPSKKSKLIDFPAISGEIPPNQVPFYIHGYLAGQKNDAMLRMYDIADIVESAFVSEMDKFNNTCTSSHFPPDYMLYGEDSSGKGLFVGFQFVVICEYQNNE